MFALQINYYIRISFKTSKMKNDTRQHLESKVKFFTKAYKTCHKSMKAYYFGEAAKYGEMLFNLK